MIFASPVQAIIGNPNQLDKSKKPSVCRLIMRKADGSPSACTAFLIAPNLAMTAAHCIPESIDWKKTPTSVSCGQIGIEKSKAKLETTKSGNFILTEGVLFDETFGILYHVLDQKSDQAVLKLANRAVQKPLHLIKAKQNEIHRCWIAGYGVNNQNYIGVLYSSGFNTKPELKEGLFLVKSSFFTPEHLKPWYLLLNGESFTSKYREITKSLDTKTMTNPMTTPGDSGGPFICQKNNGEVGVLGVIRSTVVSDFIDQVLDRKYDWDWFNHFSPINFELIQKLK